MIRLIRCNRAGEQICDLDGLQSAIRSRTVDSDDNYGDATCDKLTVTLTGEIDEGDRILFCDSMGRWVEWVAKVPETVRGGSVPITTVKCISSFEYDLEGKWVESISTKNTTAREFLTAVLEGTAWSVGVVDTTEKRMSENGDIDDFNAYKQDGISALHALCNIWGLEMYPTVTCSSAGVTSRSVNLVARRGEINPVWRFEYHRDLLEIKRTFSGKRVLTKAHIFGKGKPIMNELNVFTGHYDRKITITDVNDGKDYLEDTSLIPIFGTMQPDGSMGHTEGRIDFEQCEDVNSLLELGRKAFNEQKTPKVSYEASVLALARAGMDFGGCDIGDSVQIVDTSFASPLYLEGRVLEIEEDLMRSVDSVKLTIGNIISTRSSKVQEFSKAIQQATSSSYAWNSLIGGSQSAIELFLDRFNDVLNVTGGFTYLTENDGLWVYSEPKESAEQNPNAWVIHIGGGYFQIANSKNVDGTWKWRTAADGSGLIADIIAGGTMRAGKIESFDGSSWWNLDTGELSILASGVVTGGGESVDQALSETLGAAVVANSHATAKWGTCNTAAGTAAKVVSCSDFALFNGAEISVQFTNANTAASPTLNVNSTGAKQVWVGNAQASASNPVLWTANMTVNFVYDGTHWLVVGGATAMAATCSTAAGTNAKVASTVGTVGLIVNGSEVTVLAETASTAAAPTMNVNSTGAAAIWVNGAAASSSNKLTWAVGDQLSLTRSGNKWLLSDSGSIRRSDDAAKVATNYLNFSSSTGLVVGNMTASTLGNNVCIDSDSVDIRNGTTVLASYGANTVYLGKNNESTTIDLCNSQAKIIGNYANTDDYRSMKISSGPDTEYEASLALEGADSGTGSDPYGRAELVASQKSTGKSSHVSLDPRRASIHVREPFLSDYVLSYIDISAINPNYQIVIGTPKLVLNADDYSCSEPARFRTAIGAAASSHTHSYLPLSGGTMTGNITLRSSNITVGTAPSSNTNGDSKLFFSDKNSTAVAAIGSRFLTDGKEGLDIYTQRYVNGSWIYNSLDLYIDANGTRTVTVSDGAIWRSAIGAYSTSGGTLNGNVTIKNTEIDRDGANPSAQQTGRAFIINDKDNERIATIRADKQIDGKITLSVAAMSENTSGTEVGNWVHINAYRNGTKDIDIAAHTYIVGQHLILKSSNIDSTDGASADTAGDSRLLLRDRDNVNVGQVVSRLHTGKRSGLYIFGTNPSGVTNGLTLFVDADGTRSVAVTDAQIWRNAILGTGYNVSAVYCAYNPNNGDHYYTANKSEYDGLSGWTKQGIKFYALTK